MIAHIENLEKELDAARYSEANESGRVVRLEREANWLACELEKRVHGYEGCEEYNTTCIPSLASCGYQGPDNWRILAKQAIDKEDDGKDAELEAQER